MDADDSSYYLYVGIWGPLTLPMYKPLPDNPIDPPPLFNNNNNNNIISSDEKARKRPHGSVKTIMPIAVSRCPSQCISPKRVYPHELDSREGGISALMRVGWIKENTACMLSITPTFYRLGYIDKDGYIRDPTDQSARHRRPSDWLQLIYNELAEAGDTVLDSPLSIIGEQVELKTYGYRFISFPGLGGVNLHQMANYYFHCKHTGQYNIDFSEEFRNIPHIPYDTNKASYAALQKQNDMLRECVQRLSAFCVMQIDPCRISAAIKKAYIEKMNSSDQHITSYSILDIAIGELCRTDTHLSIDNK